MENPQKTENGTVVWSSFSPPQYIPEINRVICTPVLSAAQFKIAKLGNQPRGPSTDEWIRKIWDIHMEEYYTTIKKHEIMSFAELEVPLNSLDSESQISCFFSIWNLKKCHRAITWREKGEGMAREWWGAGNDQNMSTCVYKFTKMKFIHLP